MTFPEVTVGQWRAQVEKELAGASFEKTLVYTTPEGIAVQPLYTDVPPTEERTLGAAAPFRVCMRHDAHDPAALTDDLDGGAEAIWLRAKPDGVFAHPKAREVHVVVDGDGPDLGALSSLMQDAARHGVPTTGVRFTLAADPLARVARGTVPMTGVADALAQLGHTVTTVNERYPLGCGAMVSTVAYHEAGADAADEIALALSTGVAYLRVLLDAGLDAAGAAKHLAVQVAVGRDTFAELCKLRALRFCWSKMLTAAGVSGATMPQLHAVCSSRTLTARDPWVNLLRVSTQVFAAVLGGADLVTPASFDEAVGAPGAQGRRVARNTCLVLREESHLGRVVDPAGGAYYLEHLTEALAREGWRRFRAMEAAGGVVAALADGSLRARLDTAWAKRREVIAKRRDAITGVSEFANLDETRLTSAQGTVTGEGLPRRRDAEDFEALRDRADTVDETVALVTLGPPAEHRARVGFATALFAAGGLRVKEGTAGVVACLCGADERYATEAAEAARALKAAGCRRVLLAGRPGALEAGLREAGVDGFIYVGCDVVAALREVLGAMPERGVLAAAGPLGEAGLDDLANGGAR
jgi:methylmalonyl-CoA mutase